MIDQPGGSPRIDDVRIKNIRPLIPPAILLEEMPAGDDLARAISRHREEIQRIVRGEDSRLVVIVGPCSIHDVAAAREYADRLAPLAEELADRLKIVMRVYFEKPRTTVGWKGLINDPALDGSFQINRGLHAARGLLLDIARLGLAAGCEFLDTITPQFLADLVSWGAIGARTTESQVHRELASGLSCAVGFKNSTDGRVGVAIDAIRAAAIGHHFLSVTKQGLVAIVETAGNADCHLILRGSDRGRNDDPESVAEALPRQQPQGPPPPAGGGGERRRPAGRRRLSRHGRDDREPPRRRPAGLRRPGRPGLRPIDHRCLRRLGGDGRTAAAAGRGLSTTSFAPGPAREIQGPATCPVAS